MPQKKLEEYLDFVESPNGRRTRQRKLSTLLSKGKAEQESTTFYQHNIRGMKTKYRLLEAKLLLLLPALCLIQEAYWPDSDFGKVDLFDSRYKGMYSASGRAAVWRRSDIWAKQVWPPDWEQVRKSGMDSARDRGYEAVWCDVDVPVGEKDSVRLRMGSIYRQVGWADTTMLCQEIQAMCHNETHVVVGGDLNCYDPEWGAHLQNKQGREVAAAMADSGLHCVNADAPTWESACGRYESSVDATYVSSRIMGECHSWKFDYRYPDISDHKPVTFQMWWQQRKSADERATWDFSEAKWKRFRQRMARDINIWREKVLAVQEVTQEVLNALAQELAEILRQNMRHCIPTRRRKAREQSWWTKNLERMYQDANKTKRRWRRNRRSANLLRLYKAARERLSVATARAKAEYRARKMLRVSTQRKKELFDVYKQAKQRRRFTMPTLRSGERTANTFEERAELLLDTYLEKNTTYAQRVSPRQQRIDEEVDSWQRLREQELATATEKGISVKELKEQLAKVAPYKSPGNDDIWPICLKRGGKPLLSALVMLYNVSWRNGMLPDEWRLAIVTPIAKPGKDPTAPGSYRPISLLSVMGKLLEKIIQARLQQRAKSEKWLGERQAGFRGYRSAEDMVLTFTEETYRTRAKGGATLVSFFDLAGAYDGVWLNGMRWKLRKQYNLKGRMYWWLDAFMLGRRMAVRVEGRVSRIEALICGLPQGSPLSPFMFVLYVDDCSVAVVTTEENGLGQFADDMAVWTHAASRRDEDLIAGEVTHQREVNRLREWTIEWKLGLQLTKCETMVIVPKAARRTIAETHIWLGTVELKRVTKYKYLGIWIHETMDWTFHMEYVRKKTARNVAFICSLLHDRQGLQGAVAVHLFETLVGTVWNYGGALWSWTTSKHLKALETQHGRFLEALSGCPRASREELRAIWQSPSVDQRRQNTTLNMFRRYEFEAAKTNGRTNLLQHTWTVARSYDTASVPNCGRSALTIGAAIARRTKARKQTVRKKKWRLEGDWPDELLEKPKIHEILLSLGTHDHVLIWTDGSCDPNPGPGGCAAFVQDAVRDEEAEHKLQGVGVVSNWDMEIEGLGLAADVLCRMESETPERSERRLVLCDCEGAVNLVKGTSCSPAYSQRAAEVRSKFLCLARPPEIYWVKAHVGIGGNEKADRLAKEAQREAACAMDQLWLDGKRAEQYKCGAVSEEIWREWQASWEAKYAALSPLRQLLPQLATAGQNYYAVLARLSRQLQVEWCHVAMGRSWTPVDMSRQRRAQTDACWCGGRGDFFHYSRECAMTEAARARLKEILTDWQVWDQFMKADTRAAWTVALLTARDPMANRLDTGALHIVKAVLKWWQEMSNDIWDKTDGELGRRMRK